MLRSIHYLQPKKKTQDKEVTDPSAGDTWRGCVSNRHRTGVADRLETLCQTC